MFSVGKKYSKICQNQINKWLENYFGNAEKLITTNVRRKKDLVKVQNPIHLHFNLPTDFQQIIVHLNLISYLIHFFGLVI